MYHSTCYAQDEGRCGDVDRNGSNSGGPSHMNGDSTTCFVCGGEVPLDERVAVIGRGRPGHPIWIHQRCATHLAAGILHVIHGEIQKKSGGERRVMRRPTAAERVGLTPLEQRVLRAIASGQTNHEIALNLGIGLKSARNAVSQLLAKLGAVNRAEAVAIATREGLLE